MDQAQGIAITCHFLLGPALWRGIFQHQRLEPMSRDDHALQPVGRLGGLNHSNLPQVTQDLRRLRHEKLLLTPVFTQGAQRRQLLSVEAQLGEVVWRE